MLRNLMCWGGSRPSSTSALTPGRPAHASVHQGWETEIPDTGAEKPSARDAGRCIHTPRTNAGRSACRDPGREQNPSCRGEMLAHLGTPSRTGENTQKKDACRNALLHVLWCSLHAYPVE